MLREFNELPTLALLKRNKAIDQTYAAYAVTLDRIAELEQDLVGRAPNKERSVAACIDSAIPHREDIDAILLSS